MHLLVMLECGGHIIAAKHGGEQVGIHTARGSRLVWLGEVLPIVFIYNDLKIQSSR